MLVGRILDTQRFYSFVLVCKAISASRIKRISEPINHRFFIILPTQGRIENICSI